MNEDMNPVPQGEGTNQLVSLRNLTLIIYALYILSMFGGITALVAIIINYIKRDEVRGRPIWSLTLTGKSAPSGGALRVLPCPSC